MSRIKVTPECAYYGGDRLDFQVHGRAPYAGKPYRLVVVSGRQLDGRLSEEDMCVLADLRRQFLAQRYATNPDWMEDGKGQYILRNVLATTTHTTPDGHIAEFKMRPDGEAEAVRIERAASEPWCVSTTLKVSDDIEAWTFFRAQLYAFRDRERVLNWERLANGSWFQRTRSPDV